MNKEEIEKAKDYIRLNSKTLYDIHNLLVEVNYELFGLIFNIPEISKGEFELQQVCNYHSAPIGKRTNWGGRDKNYPTEFPGWKIMNTRGTIRNTYGVEPTKKDIEKIDSVLFENFTWCKFDTIEIQRFHNGFNIGTFNGGYDFMGCFDFFIDDFPHIKNNLEDFFPKEQIMKTYGIKDWNMFLRQRKLSKITYKFQN